ncbi:MAG: hypothetical protein KGL39_33835 [Patescibacteria group bacterium]|nr:hypothetical protein [Patescibacteria group bacterium]
MDLEIELDEALDAQKTEAGGKIPAGWYLAKVFDIFPDSANDCVKLEYEITHGPYAGKKVNDTLWDPNASDDQEKAKKSRQRLQLVALRVGAIADGETKIRFTNAIGNPVVLHLVQQQERKCDSCDEDPPKSVRKCPSCGGKIVWRDVPNGFVNPAYDGVYPLDHEKLTDEVRKQLRIVVAKRVPTEVAAAQAQTDAQANKVFGAGSSCPASSAPAAAPPVLDKQARMEAELDGF